MLSNGTSGVNEIMPYRTVLLVQLHKLRWSNINALHCFVASFPDSTPQLFIALCIKAGEWSLGTRLLLCAYYNIYKYGTMHVVRYE